MQEKTVFEKIDPMAAVYAVNATLRRIDPRLVDHGERVAYIACELCDRGELPLDCKALFLVGFFHDIGAYKTEEIDRMVEFETHDVWNHSIYGYLFLKYMTPLGDYAQAVLHHHTPWSHLCGLDVKHRDYAALLHLADRIDIALELPDAEMRLRELCENSAGLFKDEYVSVAKRRLADGRLAASLRDGSYRQKNKIRCESFYLPASEAFEYLKMLVYSIDFRSEHTVTHTVNTVSLSTNIADHFSLSDEEKDKIYLGALLHDVGKIAIPVSILEAPGRLSDEQMTVMRTHVDETRKLIEGIVPEEICEIAVRHHEKLDGSGYPKGLSAADLSFPQRIVAVADIVSALSSRRSYKEPFPKEKTLNILDSMSAAQLDKQICAYVVENYDGIIEATDPERTAVIGQYQNIMDEYSKLSDEFAAAM